MTAETDSEDVWIHTACDQCYANCGVLAHRVNGVVVKVEGDPECPHNWGHLCAKGHAAIMGLYDPYRVKAPLKRTNPEKGLGVDPGWVEISWEEAMDTIVQRLGKIREEDPRRFLFSSFDIVTLFHAGRAWLSAFGTPNPFWGPYFCGAVLHPMTYLTNGSFHSEVDLDYCNYCILMGNQMGFLAGVNPLINAQKMAEARMRGMRLVVVDPVCTNAASKADEWIPIRPGTDAALALALVNLLLNELGMYDAPFIREQTNGPYLVGADGHYLRDEEGKPLVWDAGVGLPCPAPATDCALEGSYVVKGGAARPAFHLLKEHVKKYTPEAVAEITTIPADTIRRLAREFGEAARIGATIVVEGVELPYRPAAVNAYRGAQAHKHGALGTLAMQLLNIVVGGVYAVGSHRGLNALGPARFPWGWRPRVNPDGLITPAPPVGHDPYHMEAGPPRDVGLRGLYPLAMNTDPNVPQAILNPEKFQLPFQVEAMVHCRSNHMMNKVNPPALAEALRKIPFQVSFATEVDETAEFADIVLPDAHGLERLDLFPNVYHMALSPASGYWYWGIRQPVAQGVPQARHWRDVLLEMAERLGFRPDFFMMLNYGERFGAMPYRLDPEESSSWEQIYDALAKRMFGPDKGLDWFKEHGYLKFKRTVAEAYPRPFLNARIPLYFEHILTAGEAVARASQEVGIPVDRGDYQALPDWKPCPSYEDISSDRDLYAVNYRLPIHFQSVTTKNPWLNEIAEQHPYAYRILVNADTGRGKGLKDGALIWVESEAGRVRGQVKLTECIHPEVVGIAGIFGSWARGKPVGRGKGVHFNSLLSLDAKYLDPLCLVHDSCIKVKIYPA